MTSPWRAFFRAFRGVTVLLAATGVAAEPFPQPPELRADVEFWVNVFTDYRVDEGVLHDNRRLEVVYARIELPERLSRRERNRRVGDRRKALQAVLRTLAGGKRTGLNDEEARVLALWPDDVTNDTLRAAASRIRFQQGLKQKFRRGLERSGRWRDYVMEQFTAHGVPADIVALPHVESSWDPDARSHVGASGIWQFTRSTGRRFMRVDHVVDERNDPFAATESAAKLMAYNYSIAGNWPMAITAYNHGLAGVRRAMRRHGDEALVDILRNYRGRTFGFASRNFYVAFLAAREVDRNVERYFPGLAFEPPADSRSVRLPGYMPADQLAAALGISTRSLQQHNPALQPTVWEGSKHVPKGYRLRLPPDPDKPPPAERVAGLPAAVLLERQLPDKFHKVVSGDTLSQIARTYDTRVATLVALNNLSSSHRIRIGQRLRLPAAGPAPIPDDPADREVVEAAAVASVAAEQTVEVTEQQPAALRPDQQAPAEVTQTALLSDPSDYTVADDRSIEVQPLETLGHYGEWLEIRTQRLRDINGLAFRTPVEVGQRLTLDLGTVDARTFEERRIAWHRDQQDRFFRQHTIRGVTEHTVRRGESIWVLALRQYEVPIWLFRQYNPGIDPLRLVAGSRVRMPLLESVE